MGWQRKLFQLLFLLLILILILPHHISLSL